MNKEIYEALKRIIEEARFIAETTKVGVNGAIKPTDLTLVENWIDEVAKKYTKYCECGSEAIIKNIHGKLTCEACETKRSMKEN